MPESVFHLSTNGDPDVIPGLMQQETLARAGAKTKTSLASGVMSIAKGRMGQSMSVKEQAIIRLVLHILSKRGVNHNAPRVHRLLAWCKANGFPTTTATAFDPEAW